MSEKDLETLNRMYKSRFSNPLKHRFFEFWYGARFNQKEIGGYIRRSEGGMLYRWASLLSPGSTIVEIGTFNGFSTCFLAAGAKKSKSRVYSIDPFHLDLEKQIADCDGSPYIPRKKSRDEVHKFLTSKGLDNVELIEGFSADIVKNWQRSIDFLWIDGNHNQIGDDYENWRKFLNGNARVAFHDAHPKYGITNVVNHVALVVERENLAKLEQVKGIITFIIQSS